MSFPPDVRTTQAVSATEDRDTNAHARLAFESVHLTRPIKREENAQLDNDKPDNFLLILCQVFNKAFWFFIDDN